MVAYRAKKVERFILLTSDCITFRPFHCYNSQIIHIFIIHNSQTAGKIFLSTAGKARTARSIDRLIKADGKNPSERHARLNRKGDVQMKKLLKAFGMAIMEACTVYAETYLR